MPAAFPVLVVGEPCPYLRSIVRLLHRAGATCDVLTMNPRKRPTGPVRHTLRAGIGDDGDWMTAALRWHGVHGGRVVLSSDGHLRVVRDSTLSPADQSRLLGITGPQHLGHVGSKVGLAEALARAGLPQPAFRTAAGIGELPGACAEIGFPAVVKVDRSGGGEGVFVCRCPADVQDLVPRLPPGPLLIQEWVDGDTIDLSGFFGGGRPVHFVHARFLATVTGPFSPSKVRRYTHPSSFGRALFDALSALAWALGLDGFANITAMRRHADGAMLFTEADVRPNVWVETSRHMGDDPAPAIRRYLEHGETMSWPRPPTGPTTLDIGHLLRLRAWEAWTNRHAAWCQFGDHDPRTVTRLLAGRVGGWIDSWIGS